MKAIRVLVGVAVLALGASACSSWDDDVDSRSATAGLPSLQQDLEAHEWLLQGGSSTPRIRAGRPVTIAFDDDTVHGTGPCNGYFGDLSIDDDTVQITHVAGTQMSCGDAADAAETAYLRALGRVTRAEVDDDGDTLRLRGGNVDLRYEALDVDELVVGSWEVVNIASGDAINSTIQSTTPTITFADDGRLTVDAGCNVASGTWQLDGDRLTVGSMAQTHRMCASPNGVMEQEDALVSAVERAARVSVTPDQLTILDDGDHILVVAQPHERRRS